MKTKAALFFLILKIENKILLILKDRGNIATIWRLYVTNFNS